LWSCRCRPTWWRNGAACSSWPVAKHQAGSTTGQWTRFDSTLSGATSIGAILLIARDTTPGAEFFCWTFKTDGGSEDLHRDSFHALYKSPGTTGWCSIALFPRTSKQANGQLMLLGYAGERFGTLISMLASAVPAGTQQLRSRIPLSVYDFTLEAQGLLYSPPPVVQLPPQLFIGAIAAGRR